jgi:hypothetical protein
MFMRIGLRVLREGMIFAVKNDAGFTFIIGIGIATRDGIITDFIVGIAATRDGITDFIVGIGVAATWDGITDFIVGIGVAATWDGITDFIVGITLLLKCMSMTPGGVMTWCGMFKSCHNLVFFLFIKG